MRSERKVPRPVRFAFDPPSKETSPPLPWFLQWDLQLVKWFVRQTKTFAPPRAFVLATTSRRRSADLSLVLWFLFLAFLPDLGLSYLWISVANLLLVLVLQFLAAVPRPFDLEPLWFVPGCSDDDTSGFPCVDSHMTVVVLVPILALLSSAFARSALVLVALLLALSRLCVASRFLSQILGSWLTGLAGLVAGNRGHVLVQAHRLPRGYNTAALVVVLALVLLVVGHWIESNDSRVIGVPKRDFLRVLGGILHSDASTATTVSTRPPPSENDNENGSDSEREPSERENSRPTGQHDSFFFLMRAMQARATQTE